MSDTDLILRAVSEGNPACPDGPALSRLGALVRRASVPPQDIDLSGLVLHRLDEDPVRIEERTPAPASLSEQEIDATWESGTDQAPDLVRLRQLVQGLAVPDAVDLRAAVRRRLVDVDHRRDVTQIAPASRWRLWSAVSLTHLAAVIAIAVILGALHQGPPAADGSLVGQGGSSAFAGPPAPSSPTPAPAQLPGPPHQVPTLPALPPLPSLPIALPTAWTDIHSHGLDLYALRRDSGLREQARAHFGLDASHALVAQGLSWLEHQQSLDGVVGPLTGNPDRDLAIQGLAMLALLGEGTDEPVRAAHARAGLSWIAGQLGSNTALVDGQVSTAIGALALVEGAALLGDDGLRPAAEHALLRLDAGIPPAPGPSGLGGFGLIALESAEQQGLRVPGRLLEQTIMNVARSLPGDEVVDVGRVGLAAFARMIYGQRGSNSAQREIELLARLAPARSGDGSIDPLAWFFATLAMREAGGSAWEAWSAPLQSTLSAAFRSTGVGECRIPAQAVRHAGDAGGDVFATSLAILNLQAPYRYLPVAPR